MTTARATFLVLVGLCFGLLNVAGCASERTSYEYSKEHWEKLRKVQDGLEAAQNGIAQHAQRLKQLQARGQWVDFSSADLKTTWDTIQPAPTTTGRWRRIDDTMEIFVRVSVRPNSNLATLKEFCLAVQLPPGMFSTHSPVADPIPGPIDMSLQIPKDSLAGFVGNAEFITPNWGPGVGRVLLGKDLKIGNPPAQTSFDGWNLLIFACFSSKPHIGGGNNSLRLQKLSSESFDDAFLSNPAGGLFVDMHASFRVAIIPAQSTSVP